jgi:hypothetical protein
MRIPAAFLLLVLMLATLKLCLMNYLMETRILGHWHPRLDTNCITDLKINIGS